MGELPQRERRTKIKEKRGRTKTVVKKINQNKL